jgi:enoyl-CoA hydratase/carnithine racemase
MCFSKKVILSQISGVCAGAGSMLVLCSDLSVAAQGSTFGSPFDVLPESNFVLAALTIRLNRAKAWLLRGDAMSASEALDFGLVNRIVPADKLALVSTELARSVSMPMDGITMSKMLLQSVLDSHGVGREFDMAGFYAGSFWEGGHVG